MFNRWVTGKQTAIAGGPKGRRPYLASECRDLDQADKWRQEILREIGKLVMEIQNEGLGEHRLRDMNDQINKLTREKHHWEKQIIKLGGPNYIAQGRRAMDEAAQEGFVDGMDQRGGGGGGPVYRYYGAAKNLPGVKELFQKPEKRTVRRTRAQMYRNIDMDYYGMRDDDDGVLIKLEAEATEKARAEAVAGARHTLRAVAAAPALHADAAAVVAHAAARAVVEARSHLGCGRLLALRARIAGCAHTLPGHAQPVPSAVGAAWQVTIAPRIANSA